MPLGLSPLEATPGGRVTHEEAIGNICRYSPQWAGRSSVQHPVHATFHNSSVVNGNSSDANAVHSIANADLLDADTTPSVADDNSVDANANPSVAFSKIPMGNGLSVQKFVTVRCNSAGDAHTSSDTSQPPSLHFALSTIPSCFLAFSSS